MDERNEPRAEPLTIATEAVRGSKIPVRLMLCETIDGLYAPIGLRVPRGDGPFPLVLFASGNGGGGLEVVRDFTQNRSGTQEEFLRRGYAVAWLRYRAEVDYAYDRIGRLIEDRRQNRQLLNRGPLEYEDVIDIAEAVKRLPEIDAEKLFYMGMSHGGEMALKIASEYRGFRAMIASEPAKVRARITEEVARARIAPIATPIFVQGRNSDELQGIFRVCYDLLAELGKEARWATYEHDVHGFVYVLRNAEGVYAPDAVQRQAVADSLGFFDGYLGRG